MRTWRVTTLLPLLLLARWALAAPPPVATVPMLNLTHGQVGIFDKERLENRFGVELRFRPFSRHQVIPAVGYGKAADGSSYAYSDLRRDFWLDDRWVAIPSFGFGVFTRGEELNLGDPLEFRSGIEIAYRFKHNYRAGIALFHLSNGGFADHNPGTEVLVLSLSIPLAKH